jgi:hypothetical protein
MTGKGSSRGLKLAVLIGGMLVGAGLIIFDQADAITGLFSVAPQLTGFSILEVPIDPTTGGVLGTIKLGAPDVVPIEQTGTHISTDSGCSQDFGRRLSGARNLDPVFWHNKNNGFGAFNCAYSWAQWDVNEIPAGFIATGVQFQLKVIQTTPVTGKNCVITFNDFDVDNVPEAELMIFEGIPTTTTFGSALVPSFIQDPNGAWCRTTGVKQFNLGQQGVIEVNNALTNGVGKLVMGFAPKGTGDTINSADQFKIENAYWATQGSWIISGSSPPIDCGQGFEQIDFRCVPLVCIQGEAVNATNQCAPIVCGANEELMADVCVPLQCTSGQTFNNVTNMCENVSCPIGQFSNSTNQCQPLVCDTDMGEIVSGNECVLMTCGTGMELIGANCQAIQCPVNTVLSGSNCVEISCATGSELIDGECVVGGTVGDVTCPAGFNRVGNSCAVAPETCPAGTVPAQNVCIQVVPDLMISGFPEVGIISIVGIVIFAGSFIGVVAVSIRP